MKIEDCILNICGFICLSYLKLTKFLKFSFFNTQCHSSFNFQYSTCPIVSRKGRRIENIQLFKMWDRFQSKTTASLEVSALNYEKSKLQNVLIFLYSLMNQSLPPPFDSIIFRYIPSTFWHIVKTLIKDLCQSIFLKQQ